MAAGPNRTGPDLLSATRPLKTSSREVSKEVKKARSRAGKPEKPGGRGRLLEKIRDVLGGGLYDGSAGENELPRISM
jgi:hypothetical protein